MEVERVADDANLAIHHAAGGDDVGPGADDLADPPPHLVRPVHHAAGPVMMFGGLLGMAAGGWMGISAPAEFGGQGLPATMTAAAGSFCQSTG